MAAKRLRWGAGLQHRFTVFIFPFPIKISPVVNRDAWRNLCSLFTARSADLQTFMILLQVVGSCSMQRKHTASTASSLFPILHEQKGHESWVVPLGNSLSLPPLLKAVTFGKQEPPPCTAYLPGMCFEATPSCSVVQGPPCS